MSEERRSPQDRRVNLERPSVERRAAPDRRDRMRRINTIHFVGIGGAGMGGKPADVDHRGLAGFWKVNNQHSPEYRSRRHIRVIADAVQCLASECFPRTECSRRGPGSGF